MNNNSLRAAVVGAGPSGIYTTVEILNRSPHARVDLYDLLPTPGGLVRYGVAPDHHDRRNLISVYLRKALATGRFRYCGNVEVGKHISVAELDRHYHAAVYAHGASDDRSLGVPGENLLGVHAAAEFVGWYNGHPDYTDMKFDLSGHRTVVIGNGNVALDVARILLQRPHALIRTDISEHALEALTTSKIREVIIVGRRGPHQASYTASELIALRELDAAVHTNLGDPELRPDRHVAEAPTYASVVKAKAMSDLLRASQQSRSDRQLTFQFLTSPVAILGTDRVESVRLVSNTLGIGPDRTVVAHATTESQTLQTDLVFKSVGYRGRRINGLPFDQVRAVIPSRRGRIIDLDTESTVPGHYVTGWIKRGPSGVIGTNKACAKETVASLLHDYEAGLLAAPGTSDIASLRAVRQPDQISLEDWSRIDRHEQRAGQSAGRPRRKLVTVADMVAVARRN
ncbi:FAD-dependent oxidoreductase [Mycolicibacterium sp. P9-22]|uniref:FAD-dependent oxidoreductase n=1 Tax=Mycolicibacterium sp. P9-22 TaxID=2024613 RepID=UPI001883705B|nr:FAD-dependent oxidoreductase [Mycolicibacterium sp. P9-22]